METVPEYLRVAIDEASQSLTKNKDHDLDPLPRFRVAKELRRDGTTWSVLGFKRAVYSEILCVSHVITFWDAKWPQDDRPQLLLADAKGFLDGSWDMAKAKSRWRATTFDAGAGLDTAYFVLTAASHALGLAIGAVERPDARFEINLGTITKNSQFDFPDGWDAAFCASVVYTSGVAWTGNTDKDRRFEFWNWWLHDAIPTAFSRFV